MKNRILIHILLSIILLSCTNKTPKIFIDKQLLEKIKLNDTLSYFTVINKGNSDLLIEDFSTSCDCTLLLVNKNKTIHEGDSLKVPIRIQKAETTESRRIYIVIKTNAKPQLKSFYFDIK